MSADELLEYELDGVDVETMSMDEVDLDNPGLETNSIAHTDT